MKAPYNKTSFETKGWNREEHFNFFKTFTQPFFNVHTEIDITPLYHYAKWEHLSIFLAYLHAATEAARTAENFLLRLEGEGVVKYEALDISTTILKDDKTVSFVHLPHHKDIHTFCKASSEIIAEAKTSNKLFHGYNGPDLIHATTLPWFTLNGMEHAYTHDPTDSIPKLAFGKLEWRGQQVILPLSIRVHHALADGYHIHLFLENMQKSIQASTNPRQAPALAKPVKELQFKAYASHLFERVISNVMTLI